MFYETLQTFSKKMNVGYLVLFIMLCLLSMMQNIQSKGIKFSFWSNVTQYSTIILSRPTKRFKSLPYIIRIPYSTSYVPSHRKIYGRKYKNKTNKIQSSPISNTNFDYSTVSSQTSEKSSQRKFQHKYYTRRKVSKIRKFEFTTQSKLLKRTKFDKSMKINRIKQESFQQNLKHTDTFQYTMRKMMKIMKTSKPRKLVFMTESSRAKITNFDDYIENSQITDETSQWKHQHKKNTRRKTTKRKKLVFMTRSLYKTNSVHYTETSGTSEKTFIQSVIKVLLKSTNFRKTHKEKYTTDVKYILDMWPTYPPSSYLTHHESSVPSNLKSTKFRKMHKKKYTTDVEYILDIWPTYPPSSYQTYHEYFLPSNFITRTLTNYIKIKTLFQTLVPDIVSQSLELKRQEILKNPELIWTTEEFESFQDASTWQTDVVTAQDGLYVNTKQLQESTSTKSLSTKPNTMARSRGSKITKNTMKRKPIIHTTYTTEQVKNTTMNVTVTKDYLRSSISKCYVCGPKERFAATHYECYKAFESKDQRHYWTRTKAQCIKSYWKWNSSHEFYSNKWTGGCFKRFTDVGNAYDERGCRASPPVSGPSFASRRFSHLEKMLKDKKEGCVFTPHAVLTPFARGISLWIRYHVCVCSGDYCNTQTRLQSNSFLTSILTIVILSIFINKM